MRFIIAVLVYWRIKVQYYALFPEFMQFEKVSGRFCHRGNNVSKNILFNLNKNLEERISA